jgi:alcohol dehydrogenase, propanol-preferring
MEIKTSPVIFPLQEANDALSTLRAGRFDGAAVLLP